MEKNDKKKDSAMIGICIAGIVIFLFLTIFSFVSNQKEKSSTDSEQETYQEETTTIETDNIINTTNDTAVIEPETQVLTSSSDMEEWQDDSSTYDENFHYTRFPDELLPMVDNDTDGMLKSMQEVLYANGYYSYTEARFQDYVELDYAAQTVSLSYEILANETVNVSAVYSRNTKTWNTVIW